MLSKIAGLVFFLSAPSFSAKVQNCSELFPSTQTEQNFIQALLASKPVDHLSQGWVRPALKSVHFNRLKDFIIPHVHISHGVFYPEGQLMLVEIDNHGKKTVLNPKAPRLKDHEVALIDLRNGNILSLASIFRSLDDLDISAFENFGIIQPLMHVKNQLIPQLSSDLKRSSSLHPDLKNMLPFQFPFSGPRSIKSFRMARSPFPVRDRLLFEDQFVLLPETNPVDLLKLHSVDPTMNTKNDHHIMLGEFDHSSPHNTYQAAKRIYFEKSKDLFLYPREEDIQNYTFNSSFFAAMVKEDSLKIRVWSSKTGKVIQDLPTEILSHFESDDSLQFASSPHGRWLVISSRSRILILDGKTFEIKNDVQTPEHFLNQLVFSDSENTIALQDKFHVFVWQSYPETSGNSKDALPSSTSIYQTKGIAQQILLPTDNLIFMQAILPMKTAQENSIPLAKTREDLEKQFGLRHTENAWRIYKINSQREYNPLEEIKRPSFVQPEFPTLVLPSEMPDHAKAVGNNTFYSFSNQNDVMNPVVVIKVWRKTIEP
jgi:hypothetical protein